MSDSPNPELLQDLLKQLVTRLNGVLQADAVAFQTAIVDGEPASVLATINGIVSSAYPGYFLVRRLNADDTTQSVGLYYKAGDQVQELL